MTVALSELIARREALERQIQAARAADKSEAIAKVKKLMAAHGLTLADITMRAPAGVKTGSKVAAKYLDPASGASWSGRGLKPKWLSAALASGKSLQDFAI